MSVPTLDGIRVNTISSRRLTTRVLFSGPDTGIPVLFIHGNASSATFWEETMLALPAGYRGIAPDLRGYGDADPTAKIDATRGTRDLSDDVVALLDALEIEKAHVVGHSFGGSVLWTLMMDAPERLLSVTTVAPGSPYGMGGTKDIDGTPCYDDFAGSGAILANAAFADAVRANDRGEANPLGSPRVALNKVIFKPPFRSTREEDLVSSMLTQHVGEQDYPADTVPSPNWPFFGPGVYGQANALSPKYTGDLTQLYRIDPKPPVLWVRGDSDALVSDRSLICRGTLGAAGYIPGWPGMDVFPPQPMIGQTRAVLEKYRAAGGRFEEHVFSDCGHTPYMEKADEFNRIFHNFIEGI